jgi:hypothetical protein
MRPSERSDNSEIGEAKHMNIREVQVQRVSVVSTQPFDAVVGRIDERIGHPDMAAFRRSLSAAQTEAEMEKLWIR